MTERITTGFSLPATNPNPKKTKKIMASSQVLLKPRQQALLNFLQYSEITCNHCTFSNFETGATYNEQEFCQIESFLTYLKSFLIVIITLSCHEIA